MSIGVLQFTEIRLTLYIPGTRQYIVEIDFVDFFYLLIWRILVTNVIRGYNTLQDTITLKYALTFKYNLKLFCKRHFLCFTEDGVQYPPDLKNIFGDACVYVRLQPQFECSYAVQLSGKPQFVMDSGLASGSCRQMQF